MSSPSPVFPIFGDAAQEREERRWVLLVDDEPEIRDMLSECLSKAGYRVVQSANVADANTKLAQQKFACIVTDLYLGKGDGGRIISGVRQGRGENSKTPILLMSAQLELESLKRLRPMVDCVLVKPFDMKTLLMRVAELLGVPYEPMRAQAA